jgi:hypothetical protein
VNVVRGIFGAILGALAAGVALRVRSVARERDQRVDEVLGDLPGVLADDATRIADAARTAVSDGREAAHRARIDFDEQVAARARRTKGHDG